MRGPRRRSASEIVKSETAPPEEEEPLFELLWVKVALWATHSVPATRRTYSGGPGIRTLKGFLPPVFKTGALAVLPTLQTYILQRLTAYVKIERDENGMKIASPAPFPAPPAALTSVK